MHWMGIPLLKIDAILLNPSTFSVKQLRRGYKELCVVCCVSVCVRARARACGVWPIFDCKCGGRQFRGSDGRDSRDWSEEVCSVVVAAAAAVSWCSKKLSPVLQRQRHRGSGGTQPAGGGSFCFLVTAPAALRNNLRSGAGGREREREKGEEEFHSRHPRAPLSLLFPASPLNSVGFAMGKEQELLDAARTGNLAAVEKLLSGKRQSAGSGGGSSGTGGSGNSGGHGASSHPLSSLLR